MPYSIQTSRFSFVQFEETDTITDCEIRPQNMCLPTYDDDDVWFQFKIVSNTPEESELLCPLNSPEPITIGIVENCGDGYLLQFTEKPTRYRVNATTVLYIWQEGLPNFGSVINNGECFHIMISMPSISDQTWCSNCFQKIYDTCHTSVIEYSNNENAFDFNYCAGDSGADQEDCEPLIIEFTNVPTLTMPWTAFLQARYGVMPNVQVWVRDENGELVVPGIRVAVDQYPPTELRFDFGGVSSGIIKIM